MKMATLTLIKSTTPFSNQRFTTPVSIRFDVPPTIDSRFEFVDDGGYITTSTVQEVKVKNDEMLFMTKNSTYKLGGIR